MAGQGKKLFTACRCSERSSRVLGFPPPSSIPVTTRFAMSLVSGRLWRSAPVFAISVEISPSWGASASPSDKVEYFTWLDQWQTSCLAFVVQSIHDAFKDIER